MVFGRSYGADAAIEAAFLDRIAGLLYEPPMHEAVANNVAVAARIEEMVRRGELHQSRFETEIVKPGVNPFRARSLRFSDETWFAHPCDSGPDQNRHSRPTSGKTPSCLFESETLVRRFHV